MRLGGWLFGLLLLVGCSQFSADNPVDRPGNVTKDENYDGFPDIQWTVYSIDQTCVHNVVVGLPADVVGSVEVGLSGDWAHRVSYSTNFDRFDFPVPSTAAASSLPLRLQVHYRNGTTWTQEQSLQRNSLGLSFQSLSGGSFLMGSADILDSAPARMVNLSAFQIASTVVTWAQWQSVYAERNSYGYTFDSNAPRQKADNQPACPISWYNAVLFCNLLSEKEGLKPVYYTDAAKTIVYRGGLNDLSGQWVDWNADGYSLPTEAQWEYACRAGSTGTYFWGEDKALAGNYCWFGEAADAQIHPVAQKGPNAWGLFDICGNCAQWCWDFYATYGQSDTFNPHGAADAGTKRIVRGFAMNNTVEQLQSARRGIAILRQTIYPTLGFRLVRGVKS